MGPAAVSHFSSSLSFFIVVTVATCFMIRNPMVLVEGSSEPPPCTLTVYVYQQSTPPNATAVTVASPSAANGGPLLGFGAINVVNNIVLEGPSTSSPVLGSVFGATLFELENTIFLSLTVTLRLPKHAGSISVQGATDANGNGEVGVSTGTGDFRWARGYADVNLVYNDEGNFLIKVVFNLKYD